MGKSSGGGTTTSVQKADPWVGQQPYYKDIFSQAQNLYKTGDLAPKAYEGQTIANFSPYQKMAQDLTAARALGGSSLSSAAGQQLEDTVSGKYLSPTNNPGFQQGLTDITDAYRRGTAAQTDASFARSNNLGGSAYKEMVGVNNRAFADSLNDYAGKLYDTERQRQIQGTLVAPSIANQDYFDINQLGNVGAQQQAQNQALINSNIEKFNINQQAPISALQYYSGLIGGNLGGTTTSSTPYYSNPIGSGIGGALGGAAAGAQLGSVIPGLGTGMGGIIGGGLGLLGGIF